ncbi:polyadenylate-binding protein [Rhodotorula toruloides]|uniref:Polyadenylate-binding protein n=1 Tax=Rhodotorula toruloides TaxID=5286 RepID=A0A511KJR3_RHOTO|nr:polyadenylate-binding protein [Rhodotorula toruloides]
MSADAASPTPAASEAPATASSPAPAADNSPAPAAAAAADNKDETKPASSESNASPAAQNQSSSSSNTGPSPSTSLYIGELDPTVTEAMLYEIFSMIGPVASIRVCRDAVTRRSLGYAYVNYLNSADGERALEQLNYSLIKGRPCRIMWSQRDPSLRKNGAGNIFIKNLDEQIDNKALHDTFAAFGNILSCKVAVDGQGNSLGYGFVHYDTPEAARAAIEGVNGMLLNDKVVYVGIHIPKRERQAKIDEIRAHFTNLYVKNVPLEVGEEEFRGLFEPFGKVTSAVITKDAEGNSKGFGFVNYERHEDAAKAVDALHDKDYKGQNLYVARAQRKSEREEELKKSYEQKKYEANLKYQGVNLYVKNLDDDIDDEKLRAEFEPYGQITSCKIMSDDKGASKGFGFVCFSAPDEATKALTELNGKMLGTKPLYVALAQRKDVRKQQLEAQVAQRQQIRAQQMQAAGIPGIPPYMPGAPMYYGPTAGYPQPGARGPMGYPQPGPGGMPRPRFYAPPNMPGMPPMPYPPQQFGQYPPPPPGAAGPRGAAGAPPAGPGGRPGQPPAMPAGGVPPPRGGPVPNGAPIPPRGAPVPPNGVPRPAAQGGQPPQRRPRAEEQKAQGGLTAAMLANAAPQEQKQMLGEALYPRIHASQPELAGKVTGMLLEMDSSELLYLLENDEALAAKVQEALDVLAEYNQRQTGDEASGDEAPAAAPAAEATEEVSA